MNIKLLLHFGIGALLPAAGGIAQTPELIHTLGWTEVVAGTNTPVGMPNGIIDPGEAARIGFSISFTAVGTPVAYQLPTPGGIAPVAGFSGSGFNVAATGALGGTWSFLTVTPGFVGNIGNFAPDGSLELCNVSAPQPPPGVLPNSTNPLADIWQVVWTPSTYQPRQSLFELQPFMSIPPILPTLWVLRGLDPSGNPLLGLSRGSGIYSGVSIPVVPTPGVGVIAILGLSIGVVRRQRR